MPADFITNNATYISQESENLHHWKLQTGTYIITANLQFILYILKTNPHLFYSFRGLKNQMRIRITCGLDSRSRAGFWKNDTSHCTCCKNNTIIYYLYYIIHSLSITQSLSYSHSMSSSDLSKALLMKGPLLHSIPK